MSGSTATRVRSSPSVLLQDAGDLASARCSGRRPDARHRAHRGRRGRPAQGAGRPVDIRFLCLLAARPGRRGVPRRPSRRADLDGGDRRAAERPRLYRPRPGRRRRSDVRHPRTCPVGMLRGRCPLLCSPSPRRPRSTPTSSLRRARQHDPGPDRAAAARAACAARALIHAVCGFPGVGGPRLPEWESGSREKRKDGGERLVDEPDGQDRAERAENAERPCPCPRRCRYGLSSRLPLRRWNEGRPSERLPSPRRRVGGAAAPQPPLVSAPSHGMRTRPARTGPRNGP